MQVRSLGQEDPLEQGMATHSSILAWRILWTEEPGGLQSMGSKRVIHDWSNLAHKALSIGPIVSGGARNQGLRAGSELCPSHWSLELYTWPLNLEMWLVLTEMRGKSKMHISSWLSVKKEWKYNMSLLIFYIIYKLRWYFVYAGLHRYFVKNKSSPLSLFFNMIVRNVRLHMSHIVLLLDSAALDHITGIFS